MYNTDVAYEKDICSFPDETKLILKLLRVGDTEIVERVAALSMEGASFRDVSQNEMDELDIDGGAMIVDIGDGKWKEAGIERGFIVTSVDKKPVDGVADLRSSLENKRGGTLIEGIYPDGTKAFFGIGW